MGGSGKSKQKKGKGKSKYKKSVYTEQPETCISNPNADTTHDSEAVSTAERLNILKNKSYGEVENLLYTEIDSIYAQALKKLVDIGYDGELAEKAILMNGHAFGNWNVFNSIVINSFTYITSGFISEKCSLNDFNYLSDRVDDLLELMVELVQEAQPEWDRFDAIRHILELTTRLGLASSMSFQSLQSGIRGNVEEGSHIDGISNENDLLSLDSFPREDQLKASELPKRFGFSPGMESLLKQNAKTIVALLHPVDPDDSPAYREAVDYLSSSTSEERTDDQVIGSGYFLKLAGCSSEGLNLKEWLQKSGEDPRNELILDVVQHHVELMKQVQERREWACAKAKQAEEKLIQHVSELRMLRIEKFASEQMEINRKSRPEKNANKVLEMESDLLASLDQLEVATAAVQRLERENSKIRAEKEAHLLGASLSKIELREERKRERKRAAAIEKGRDQLEKLVEEQKQEALLLNQELDQLRTKQKEAQDSWREQLKKKEMAVALVAKEEKMKKKSEANLRNKHSSLRQKMKTNSESMSNEVSKLEKELANLEESSWIELGFEMAPTLGYSHTSDNEDDSNSGDEGRNCIICSTNQVSILFLPCAHQVVCSNCNDRREIVGDDHCPCCHTKIEAKVTIHGISS